LCSEIIHSCDNSRYAQFSLQGVLAEIFADRLRDKFFDTEIVAALRCALSDVDSRVRQLTVKFFIAAIAQGALSLFCGPFISKYLQMAFVRRYLTRSSSSHLDVRGVIMIPSSEAACSISSKRA
jgi:hypothetical protein